MKYYVIADIHGFYKEMYTALENSGYFAETEPHKLIILGDLFDRGKEPERVQDFVCGLLDRDEVILIKGNHEDLMEDLVYNAPMWFTSGVQYTHHYSNGTIKTLLQLTKSSLQNALAFPEIVAAHMRHTPFFTKILPKMRNMYETEHYIFVHGYIPCNTNGGKRPTDYDPRPDWRQATEAEWENARWYNGMDADKQGAGEKGKIIVCGHWNTSYGHSVYEGKGEEFGKGADFSPYKTKGLIAIDACTAFSKKVNVLVIEDGELRDGTQS